MRWRRSDQGQELRNAFNRLVVVSPDAAPSTAPADDAAASDRVAMRRARFLELAEPRLDYAYRLAGLLLGNATDAEDAVQDALATAWRSFDTLREPDRFATWFTRIVANRCRDVRRRRRTIRFVPIDGASHVVGADPFAEALTRDAVLTPLAQLSPDLREIVVLHYWADLPLDEVGVVLGIPAGTVRSRLHRALEWMRASMPPEAVG